VVEREKGGDKLSSLKFSIALLLESGRMATDASLKRLLDVPSLLLNDVPVSPRPTFAVCCSPTSPTSRASTRSSDGAGSSHCRQEAGPDELAGQALLQEPHACRGGGPMRWCALYAAASIDIYSSVREVVQVIDDCILTFDMTTSEKFPMYAQSCMWAIAASMTGVISDCSVQASECGSTVPMLFISTVTILIMAWLVGSLRQAMLAKETVLPEGGVVDQWSR